MPRSPRATPATARRLTGQQTSGSAATFGYDTRGNMTTMWHQGSQPRTFMFDAANRILTLQDGPTLVSYTYDDDGNQTAERRTTGITVFTTLWSYDQENRLLVENVVNQVPPKTTYTYSVDGLRRSTKTGGGTLTTFIWDGSDYLAEDKS